MIRPHARSRTVGYVALVMLCGVGCGLQSGCGGREQVSLVPVAGKVIVGNAPLKLKDGQFGRVWYYPMKDKGNSSPHVPCGDIDAEGRYKLYTLGKSGAPPGWYRVMTIAGVNSEAGRPKPKRKLLINERYTSFETSGIVIQVAEGAGEPAFDLKLKF